MNAHVEDKNLTKVKNKGCKGTRLEESLVMRDPGSFIRGGQTLTFL